MLRRSLLSLGPVGLLAACGRGPGQEQPTASPDDARTTLGQRPLNPASATASSDPVPVLVELFSSEGCSSCPPADAILAQLVEQQPIEGIRVIGVEQHVDYWDDLGWKDPYASAQFTERQRSYAKVRRSNSVFTPEAVVNGHISVVGSERASLVRAIQSAADASMLALRLERRASTLVVAIPPGLSPEVGLVVVALERHLGSKPARGENAGRALAHAPLARSLTEHTLRGTTLSLDVGPPKPDREIVAFLQDPTSRAVIAMASVT